MDGLMDGLIDTMYNNSIDLRSNLVTPSFYGYAYLPVVRYAHCL